MKLVLLLCVAVVCARAQTILSGYDHVAALDDKYNLHWRIDEPHIYLAMQVETTGWVGFGLAEQAVGAMPGSDILTGRVKDGVATIEDRHATEHALPPQDDCNDWSLLGGSEEDGVTIIEVRRLLEASDPAQDRSFPGADTIARIIFAYGDDGEEEVQYHGSRRAPIAVNFWDADIPMSGEDVPHDFYTDIVMTDFEVPSDRTTYACKSFEIDDSTTPHHIVAFEAVIENVDLVHHLVLHICDEAGDTFQDYFGENQKVCNNSLANPSSGCTSVIWAWAVGMPIFLLPEVAGFRTGANNIRYVAIEYHYNNVEGLEGVLDNSGVRLYSTNTLREHDAGVLWIGDPMVSGGVIPKGEDFFELEFMCKSECTETLPWALNVFATFQHMHEVGAEIWSRHWTPAHEDLGMTHKIEFWQFDFQNTVKQNWTLLPGDSIHTHCVYDTTGKSEDVYFGAESWNEMCMEFIYYWPAVEGFNYCGSAGGEGYEALNVCANDIWFGTVEEADGTRPTDTRQFGTADERDECPVDEDDAGAAAGVFGDCARSIAVAAAAAVTAAMAPAMFYF